jgi:adenine-specific DNA-methyltransferase
VFHVPETISNLIDVETKGKVNKPTSLFTSKFSQKRFVKKSYQDLVDGVAEITDNFLISYSNEGLLSIDEIVDILRKKFFEVKTFNVDYRKFNTNRKKDKNIVNEFLIYGKK